MTSLLVHWKTVPLKRHNYTRLLEITSDDVITTVEYSTSYNNGIMNNEYTTVTMNDSYTTDDEIFMSALNDDDANDIVNDQFYWHTFDNIDSCIKHVITLNIDTETCSDSITTEQYVTGKLINNNIMQIKIITSFNVLIVKPTPVTVVHVRRTKSGDMHLIVIQIAVST